MIFSVSSHVSYIAELRPDRTSYLLFSITDVLFLLLVSLIGGGLVPIFWPEWAVWSFLPAVVSAFLLLIRWYWAVIQYRKERYFFDESTIRTEYGSPISSSKIRLNIENITHVTMIRPFLANYFFGVGHVLIESAGSGGVECYLSFVKNPEQMYGQVQERMEKAGFSLKRDELVQHEKPNISVGLLEVAGMIFSSLILLPVVLIAFSPATLGEDDVDPEVVFDFIDEYFLYLAIGYGLYAFLILVSRGMWLLDLQRRDYYLYSDLVEYDEGFLTKVNSIVPIKNVADANFSQNVVERVLGVYDVMISCQGSGREIHFKNLKRGVELEQNIDQLIQHKNAQVEAAHEQTLQEQTSSSLEHNTDSVAQKSSSVPLLVQGREPLRREKAYATELFMDPR